MDRDRRKRGGEECMRETGRQGGNDREDKEWEIVSNN